MDEKQFAAKYASRFVKNLRNRSGQIFPLLALSSLAACGGASQGGPVVTPPAAPNTPPATPPATGYVESPAGTFTAASNSNQQLFQGAATSDLIVNSLGGNDLISTGSGNDIIAGGAGNDVISSGSGNDFIRAGLGVDTVSGGPGNDVFVIVGTTGASDYIASDITNPGGSGIDLSSLLTLSTLNGQALSEAASGEAIDGGAGNDVLVLYGAVDLSGMQFQNLSTLQINSTVTVTPDQLGQFSTINGDGSSVINIVADSNDPATYRVDLAATSVNNVASMTSQGSVQIQISSAADISGKVGTIAGDGNITLVLSANGASANIVSLNSLTGLVSGVTNIHIDSGVTLMVDSASALASLGVAEIMGDGQVSVADAVSSASLFTGLSIDDDLSLLSEGGAAVVATSLGGQTLSDPELRIDDVRVKEALGTATFTVSLSAASSKTVKVNYTMPDGKAGVLQFAPGEVSKTLTTTWSDDRTVEDNEKQIITLSNAVNADIRDGSGTLTILDDDLTNDHIQVGETITVSSQLGTGKANHTIAVELVAGQTYRIALDPSDASTASIRDPYIEDILDAQGNSLGISDDDSGKGVAALILFTPTTSGNYFVVARTPDNMFLGGTVTLSVETFTPPSDTTNVTPIAIGGLFTSSIDSASDTDAVTISLQAGVPVDITLFGNDNGNYGDLYSPKIVSFLGPDGVAVSSGTYDIVHAYKHLFSEVYQITFTPTQSGTYTLEVGSTSGVGDYGVAVAEKDKGIYNIRANEQFQATGNPEIDAFFLGHNPDFWKNDHIISDRDGDGTTILTFSVPDANSAWNEAWHNPIHSAAASNLQPATGVALQAFYSVMSQISKYANIQFVEVPETSTQAGDFRFAFTGFTASSSTGFANGFSGFPEWVSVGETWLNPVRSNLNIDYFESITPLTLDRDAYFVNRVFHEFTHNLGLQHFDQSSLASQIDPTFYGQDYSVMSRASSGRVNGSVLGDFFPQTLMWFDIQAIQAAYGKNTTSTAGNDVYTIDTGIKNFSTIWDYSGNDTLVLTGSADTTIDLTPGTWQFVGTTVNYVNSSLVSAGSRSDTVFIAPDTIIENVTAGSGNDTLKGNDANNRMDGGAGDDSLTGGNGADTFVFSGNWGQDHILDFTDGSDKIDMSGTALNFQALNITQSGADVVISDGAGNSVTIDNVDISLINEDDFIWG